MVRTGLTIHWCWITFKLKSRIITGHCPDESLLCLQAHAWITS